MRTRIAEAALVPRRATYAYDGTSDVNADVNHIRRTSRDNNNYCESCSSRYYCPYLLLAGKSNGNYRSVV